MDDMWSQSYFFQWSTPLKNAAHQPLSPFWVKLTLIDLHSADDRVTGPILIYIMIGHGLAAVTFNRRKHINQQDVYPGPISNMSQAIAVSGDRDEPLFYANSFSVNEAERILWLVPNNTWRLRSFVALIQLN